MKLVGPISTPVMTLAMAATLGGCGTQSSSSTAENSTSNPSPVPSTDASGDIVGPCADSAGATAPGTRLVALLDLSADNTLTYSMTHHVRMPGAHGTQESCGDRMTMTVSEHVPITAEHGTICDDRQTAAGPCTLAQVKDNAAHWSQVTPIAYIHIDADRVVEIDEIYNG
ncbi:hypothetical protein [Nocardia aurantiaca]|uniref:Lipoprotein n=1 Tax=Nocardia aurantiaca TaxID=2675850 RepID=A0A6I3L091_9NOCA|nr:hypothetical protein [Nocardia aurantiaca]MTE14105.1 hypothetical protein [Nocardia aurantiaca]